MVESLSKHKRKGGTFPSKLDKPNVNTGKTGSVEVTTISYINMVHSMIDKTYMFTVADVSSSNTRVKTFSSVVRMFLCTFLVEEDIKTCRTIRLCNPTTEP